MGRITVLSDIYQRFTGSRGFSGSPFTASALTATTNTGIKVEIFIDESWQDISKDVRYASRVVIAGGRSDEASQLQRGTCKFSLNNRNGKYSPRNPLSPLYGKIGRNTRVRVSTEQAGTTRYRFHGEIVAWPGQWDVSDTDVWVPVEGSGVLRRLNQGTKPLRSAIYRTLTRETVDHIKAYWPCEDSSGSTSLASALSGGAAMKITGAVSPNSYAGFAASDSIVTLGAGSFSGTVPTYIVDPADADGNGPYLRTRFLLNVPSGGTTNGAVLLRVNTTGGTARWDVIYLTTSGGSLRLNAYDTTGAQIDVSTDLTTSALNGKDVIVSVSMIDDSITSLVSSITVYYDDGTVSTNAAGIIAGAHVGKVKSVTVTPDSDCSGISVGHIWLITDFNFNVGLQALIDGHKGESAFTRISRLCAEEGVSFSGTNPGNDDTTLGIQNIDTLVNLLNDCADADLGLLFETRDQLGVGYRPRTSLYNQDPKLTLAYLTNDLISPATPVDDDQLTKNDIETKRRNGSSVRIIQSTGPLSIQPPPDGVGLYDISTTINIETDAQLASQAAWRLHLGTVDEPRYPVIEVHLQRNSFLNSYDLTAAALTLATGDRILITGQPSHEGGADINVIAQAYTETIDQFEHRISWNGAPNSPYQVAVADGVGEFVTRADSDGTTLLYGVTSTDTSLIVLHTTPTDKPYWSSVDVPFDISLGGEEVTVTAVYGPDYGFEISTSDWSPADCTIAQSNTHTWRGDFAMLMTVVGAPSQAYVRPNGVRIIAGNSYTTSMWVYSVAGYGNVRAVIDWSDAGGNYLSSSSTGFAVPAAQWTYITVTDIAPVSALFASYGPTLSSSPAAGTALWVDEVLIEPHRTQTLTVTRSVNGIVKEQTAGTEIALTQGAFVAL